MPTIVCEMTIHCAASRKDTSATVTISMERNPGEVRVVVAQQVPRKSTFQEEPGMMKRPKVPLAVERSTVKEFRPGMVQPFVSLAFGGTASWRWKGPMRWPGLGEPTYP